MRSAGRWVNRRRFRAAQRRLGDSDMVCGVMTQRGPFYFVADRSTDPDELQRLAFRAVHGRDPSPTEQFLGSALNGSLINAAKEALSNYLSDRENP